MTRVRNLWAGVLCILGVAGLYAQNNDEVLFTVEGKPVTVSEFNYIYNKNNGDEADYSRESVEEYLDLYKKFKLKVQKARDMKLDTIPELINELAGYRKQLADSYLTDKEVSEDLVREVYDRQAYDVKVRHIVVKVPSRATDDQVEEARQKIESIAERIHGGENFAEVAKVASEDATTRLNGGELNYLTAMLPNGYYEFENAMYQLEPGEVSEPLKSNVGFHLVQVIDKRPARGQMHAAHILLRKKKNGQPAEGVKELADSLYNVLQKGGDFAQLARQYSEDSNSKDKGGDIGVFGISTYENNFEDAAYALKNDGDISEPVETSIGWHIIKRLDKPEREPYDQVRRRIQADIKQDDRYQLAKDQMIEDIKEMAGFTENTELLQQFIDSLDETFYSYKWQIPQGVSGTLFTLGGQDYSMGIFANEARKNTRKRLRFSKSAPLEASVMELYNDYVREQAMEYEEANLEQKYPEFGALMREYREGILLFEATKINVWDKASQDTAGLREFYEENKDDYMWKERADMETLLVITEDKKLIKKISKYFKKHSGEEVVEKFHSQETPVTYRSSTHERGDLDVAGINWKEGAISDERYDSKSNTAKLRKITKIYPATPKTLKDARGYIIADYQDSLDKEWIESLERQYEIKVNEEVLDKLIRD
ncbi:peptidylprolyl isomerase [Portibacter marinus]|uniref:peptidylprolyl isomerase n=1 Tax=Portibacter marinus TaxID=2898660 RepID=UPI001F2D396C|nr:peptidylprolyl isomerase [Portibacter marinus]